MGKIRKKLNSFNVKFPLRSAKIGSAAREYLCQHRGIKDGNTAEDYMGYDSSVLVARHIAE